MQDGFASRDEAIAFARSVWKESQKEYSELYPERYDGEHWKAVGGRCHLQAYRMLTEEYDRLIESGYCGDSPVLVHAYCMNVKTVGGKSVPSGHAWIEGGGRVLDCGSYILKPTPHDKDDYYEARKIVRAYRYTREEAERHFDRADGLPYPWDRPPEHFARERAIWEALQ